MLTIVSSVKYYRSVKKEKKSNTIWICRDGLRGENVKL